MDSAEIQSFLSLIPVKDSTLIVASNTGVSSSAMAYIVHIATPCFDDPVVSIVTAGL